MTSTGVAQIAPLSPDQSAALVNLSLKAARAAGLNVTYNGDATLISGDSSRAVLGLTNLARTVAACDQIEWPGVIKKHFAAVIAELRPGRPPRPADPANQLVQRLVPREALPAAWTAELEDFLPGLVSVPATINDGTVRMYLKPADLDLTWSEAEGFGLANLRKLSYDVEYEEYDGARFAFVTGTVFAASKALVLDTVIQDSLYPASAQYGVLAALPARDVLMIHIIEDLSVLPALGHLVNLAASHYATGQGPLTPTVYWVTPERRWHPTIAASPGRTSLLLSPQIKTLLLDLAAREQGTGTTN